MNYLQQKKHALLSKLKQGLPSGYKQVEYLTSGGSQYILTDFIPKIGDSIVLYFRRKKIHEYDAPIYSMSKEDSGRQVAVLFGIKATFYKYFTTNEASYFTSTFFSRELQKIEISSNGTINIAGQILTTEVSKEKQETNAPLYVFERSDHTSHYIGDIGIINFKRNNINVLNLIPCLDNNNRPCMYDTVSKKSYYNVGRGEFKYGEVIN